METYFNLDKDFIPFGEGIKYEGFRFSDGTFHIKISGDFKIIPQDTVIITFRGHDIMKVVTANDVLKRKGITSIKLFMPFCLGARQDRVMVDGEPLTAKIYADIINACNFNEVIIIDSHSDVSPALIDNCVNIPNHEFVHQSLTHLLPIETLPAGNPDRRFKLISPDAGSNKKMKDVCSFLSQKGRYNFELVKCDKSRDVSNGKITGFEVYADDLQGQKCIIVDDICDGGGTFLGLAEKLKEKGAGDLYLLVTHGIFSKGFKELRKHFKGIYTTDSIRRDFWNEPHMEKGSEIVTILKLNEIIGC